MVRALLPQKFIHDEKYCFHVKSKECGLWQIESSDPDAGGPITGTLVQSKATSSLERGDGTASREALFKIYPGANGAVEIKSALPSVQDSTTLIYPSNVDVIDLDGSSNDIIDETSCIRHDKSLDSDGLPRGSLYLQHARHQIQP